MKKNLLGVIVIIFVIFACVLVIKEISSQAASEVVTLQFYADSE